MSHVVGLQRERKSLARDLAVSRSLNSAFKDTYAYSLLYHIPQAYDQGSFLVCWLILAAVIVKVLITCTSLFLAILLALKTRNSLSLF